MSESDLACCWKCGKKQPYKILTRPRQRFVSYYGYESHCITIDEEYAVCLVCGRELDVPELDRNNEQRYMDIIKGGLKENE